MKVLSLLFFSGLLCFFGQPQRQPLFLSKGISPRFSSAYLFREISADSFAISQKEEGLFNRLDLAKIMIFLSLSDFCISLITERFLEIAFIQLHFFLF